MQIQTNTDSNIEGHEALTSHVSSTVETALERFSDHITRVEVQLSDENSGKKSGVDDMRCVMEARLEGRQPVAVTHEASTVHHGVDGAAGKLHSLIESTLGRLVNRLGFRKLSVRPRHHEQDPGLVTREVAAEHAPEVVKLGPAAVVAIKRRHRS